MTRLHRTALAAGAVAVALVVASCSGSNSSPGGNSSGDWILGTTDTVTSLDPAGAYDIGSWNVQYSTFQQLVNIPAGASEVTGDAAEKCAYDDPKTITCTLKKDLTFSNGNALTSSDVKFSLERNLKIADPNGSAVLLGSISNGDEKAPGLAENAIETPDDTTVKFNLTRADTTFLKVLSTATASIVDEETFPADKLLGDADIIGSGPYKVASFTKGQQAVFEKNSNYSGDRDGKAGKIFVQYFKEASPLRQALEQGEVDVAWRTLSPTDLNDLKTKEGIKVVEGKGSEFRYWVVNHTSEVGKQSVVRQAIAQIIDRDAIAKDSYDGTVNPAYSIVPPGFAGEKDSFKEKYGAPDVAKAKKLLADANVKTPVKITLGYSPKHYGPNAVDETNQLAEQLKASGLFTPDVQSAEWNEYQKLYKQGAYDLFHLGWYPDILDADNYLTPFIVDGGFFANGYSNADVNAMVNEELAETDEAKRTAIIEKLQDQVAADVPLIPSWNGKNVAVASDKISGLEETLDPSYIFRLWMVSKK